MGYDMYVEKRTNEDMGSWYENSNPDYFRLNISGMGRCVEIMRTHGMTVQDDSPDFPPWNEGADGEASAEYDKACQRITAYRRQRPGIPEGKVSGTNDGWHVHPEECRQALDAYAASTADKTQQPEWFGEWLQFLEHAEKQGGFRVR